MFAQIITGKVSDADLLRRQDERWIAEIKPGAKGYLGYTGGITPDGRYIGIARFESAEAAQANSSSPQQDAWFNETVKGFDGEPKFIDSSTIDTPFGGGSNEAGFVQVIQGRAKNPDLLRQMGGEREAELRKNRPDILGMLVVWHGDGKDFTQAVYFRSEQEARQNEKATESNEMRQEYQDMFDGEPTFYDLPNPMLD